ncbi:hypothetical protein [Candidatus Korobacter versatilis]|nr:hypothetical protein [Candidatus Koribacter versatilis]
MKRWFAVALAICALLAMGEAQEKVQETASFNPAKYPRNLYIVTRREFPLESASVRVIQARARNFVGAPADCNAFIEVRRDEAVVTRLSFLAIDPGGFSFGLFLPLRQPIPDALVIMKEGDYDGRMIVISGDGKVANLPGGLYFQTEDKRYLIGLHMRDDTGLAVVDVATRSMVLDEKALKDSGEIGEFYKDERGYFFTFHTEPPRDEFLRLDLEHRRLVKDSSAALRSARKVEWDFTPGEMVDCTTK